VDNIILNLKVINKLFLIGNKINKFNEKDKLETDSLIFFNSCFLFINFNIT
jgi:hypothetical protein